MTAHQSNDEPLDLDEVTAAISKKKIVRRRPARPKSGPRFYSAAEAADLLGTSTVTIYRAVRDGELQGVRIRGRVIVPAKAIEALAEAPDPAEATPLDFLRQQGRA